MDPVKKTQVLEDAFRIVDKQVNATLPQVTLDTQEVGFHSSCCSSSKMSQIVECFVYLLLFTVVFR